MRIIELDPGVDQADIRAKYPRTPDMGEISGFGGGYEATCVNMFYAALQVLDPIRDEVRSRISGRSIGDYPELNAYTGGKLEKALMRACNNDCTGAMHGAAVQHAVAVIKVGYESYAKALREQRTNSESKESDL